MTGQALHPPASAPGVGGGRSPEGSYDAANGAHRMKEALAVISVGYETEASAGQNAPQIKKSRSVPKITMGGWSQYLP